MSETELPRGGTKFLFGQKIDSIELRTTKMAVRVRGQSTENRIQLNRHIHLRRKKQILANH
jgi:hypothetical protein